MNPVFLTIQFFINLLKLGKCHQVLLMTQLLKTSFVSEKHAFEEQSKAYYRVISIFFWHNSKVEDIHSYTSLLTKGALDDRGHLVPDEALLGCSSFWSKHYYAFFNTHVSQGVCKFVFFFFCGCSQRSTRSLWMTCFAAISLSLYGFRWLQVLFLLEERTNQTKKH